MSAWPSSLRSRLTFWYAALLALPLIAFALVCYFVFETALLNRTDRFINDALAAFSRELVAERRSAATIETAMQTTVDEVRFHDLQIAILDSARRVVAMTALSDDDAIVGGRPTPESRLRSPIAATILGYDVTRPLALSVASAGETYRVISRPLALRGQSFGLTGAYSLADIEAVLARIREIFAVAIPLLILSAATGGYFLAKRSLAPVSAMTSRAAAISAANLHERLPVSGGDELVGLARVVNDLLDRLENSFDQQRRFMQDASHELRTPAAILRAETDVTLARPHRDEDEYRASIAVMQGAARRLTRIVDDLFLLARADAGHLVMHREPLYLEELVHDAARGVRQVADQRGVRVGLGHVTEAPFEGDPDLLGRLLLNLLDNAIKYSPENGAVDISMEHHGGRFEVSVVDAGPGIPPDAQARVFERFFRADSVRTTSDNGSTSGAGLGLAIARRIAELHGGQLDLIESRPGRTEFRLTLPAAPESS
jgi:heavy metal sensor kinase